MVRNTIKKISPMVLYLRKVAVPLTVVVVVGLWGLGRNAVTTAAENAEAALETAEAAEQMAANNKAEIEELKSCYTKVSDKLEETNTKLTTMDKNVSTEMGKQTVYLEMLLKREGLEPSH